MHDVTVLDEILFPFQAKLPLFAGFGFAAAFDKVFIAHHFGTDEAFFKVGVDLAGRFGCAGAAAHGPGTVLGLPDGEKRDEVQQLVPLAGQLIESGFLKAHPEYSWARGLLRDMKPSPWTLFWATMRPGQNRAE